MVERGAHPRAREPVAHEVHPSDAVSAPISHASAHALIDRGELSVAALCAALGSSEQDPIARFGRSVPLVTDGYLLQLDGWRDGRRLEHVLAVELGLRQARYALCGAAGAVVWIPGVDEPSVPRLDALLEARGGLVRGLFHSRALHAQARLHAAVRRGDITAEERLFCWYREHSDAGYAECLDWIALETAKLRERLAREP